MGAKENTEKRAGRAAALRQELASKIASAIGTQEKQATAIQRLTLHQRSAPTPPCHVTYEPGVIVVAQGRKEVQIGKEIQVYDSSRYLLISVDLPTVTRVTEASEKEPCLAVSLTLDLSVSLSASFSAAMNSTGRMHYRTIPLWPLLRSPRSS